MPPEFGEAVAQRRHLLLQLLAHVLVLSSSGLFLLGPRLIRRASGGFLSQNTTVSLHVAQNSNAKSCDP